MGDNKELEAILRGAEASIMYMVLVSHSEMTKQL